MAVITNHSRRIEHRTDKYGQVRRIVCSCGVTTNWHTEYWKAQESFWPAHTKNK